MNEVPDIKSELERKTLDTLERTIFDLQNRKITIVAALFTVKTLWDMASGLISRETMELIGATSRGLDAKYHAMSPPDQVAVLSLGENIAHLVRHGVGVELVLHQGEKSVRKVYLAPKTEVQPCLWAANQFKSLVDNLTGKNYKRIT